MIYPWPEILVDLTAEVDSFVAWKHVDSGLAGSGDIDTMSNRKDWPRVLELVGNRVRESGAHSIAVCKHVPGACLMFVASPTRGWPAVEEFDVADSCSFRGARWCRSEALVDLSCLDDRGIRVPRPGAQAWILTVLYGLSVGGEFDAGRLRPTDLVAWSSGIEADSEGFIAAARMLMPREISGASMRLARRILESPEAAAADRLGVLGGASAALHPVNAARQIAFRIRKRCFGLSLAQSRRTYEGRYDAYVTEVARHEELVFSK